MTTRISKIGLPVTEVANFFLAFGNDTGEPITNLKLQKLVYYAQAWSLGLKRQALFNDDFEAWIHGPVLPALYKTYKDFGSKPITANMNLETIKKTLSPDVFALLEEVAKVYMRFGAYELELMTHQETPWKKARKNLAIDALSNEKISKESMLIFYEQISQEH